MLALLPDKIINGTGAASASPPKPVEAGELCAAIGELCTRRPGRTWPRR